MRRFSTLALSLLTILVGLTAWAQVSREGVRKVARATGDITLVSANPASGSTVASLDKISLTWSTAIDIFDPFLAFGEVKDEAGEKVADFEYEYFESDYEAVCSVSPAITAPGNYTVSINPNVVMEFDPETWESNPNVSNGAYELTYTIDGSGAPVGTRPVVVSTTPSAPVETLSSIAVTFDQPVELSTGAGMMRFQVYEQNDIITDITSATAGVKVGDDKTVVFMLNEPISTPGTYCINVEEGFVYPKGNPSESLVSDFFVATATVGGSGSGSGEVGYNAKLELQYPTGDSVEDLSFGLINFGVDSGSTLDESVTLYLVNEAGEKFPLTAQIFMNTTLIIHADDVTVSGTYTLTIPAGYITNKTGEKNAEFTKTWTYTNPKSDVEDDRKLELVYAKLVNEETNEELDLLNPNTKVPSVGNGWTLKVLPNIFDVAEQINVAFSHYGVDEYGNEGEVIDKRVEMYASDRTAECFQKSLAGNTKLEEGTTYTITFDAVNTMIPEALRHDWGKVEATVQGGSAPFVYSDAELVSVFPAEDSDIFNVNQVFRLTFSQPVDITVELNEGMGVSSPIYTAMPANEERTVWTFTISPSVLEAEMSYVNVIVFAKDDNGLILKGNNGIEDKSCFSISWACHLGCPRVIITPEAGVVESIYSFTAVADDGKEIQLGSALDKPYLTTASGARVAEVDMNSEKKYLANGQVIDPNDDNISDAGSVKVTFNLDKEITTPGKYILNVPFAAFGLGTQFSGSSNRPMQIEYIIDGDPVYDRVSIADGAQLSELSYVMVYANADVDFGETGEASMLLRSSEGVLATSNLIKAMNEGVTMLIADFSTDGKPLQLEADVDYTLTIAKNSIFLMGTDIAFPALNVNVKGVAANTVATVALTEKIAGSATSVNNVVKGSTVAVTFEPADGWKVGSVEFNGTDVTASVVNNVYTTPALDADATLVATYEFEGTLFTPSNATELITDFKLLVGSENGEIVVKNLTAGMVVNVFTVDGANMGQYTVADMDVLNIKVPAGVYVVTITLNGKTQAVKIVNK